MKKYLMLSAILFCLMSTTSFAQEDEETSGGSFLGGLQFTASLNFGNANFMTNAMDVPAAGDPYTGTLANSYWVIPGDAPYANVISADDNNITNMAGIEARAFINDQMAVRFSAGAIIRNTPARDNIPGVIDPSSPNVTWIPNYEAVTADGRFDVNITAGFEYHFTKKNNLDLYGAVAIPFYYGRWSQYNPTVDVSEAGEVLITDVGTRHMETIGIGTQLIAGADYYLKDNLYIGIEIKPFSYVYAFNERFAGPGLETLQANTQTFGFFTQPVFKIGFKL